MKTLVKSISLSFWVVFCVSTTFAQTGLTDVPINQEKAITTTLGVAGLPSSLGTAEDHMAVLRIAPLTPGTRYEATLTFDAGTDIGYGHSWLDGNPFQSDWASLVGIGTGTGTREMIGRQEKFIFSINPSSTANTLFIVVRSSKPFTFNFLVSDILSGATPESQDAWGYYYVDDFDADNTSPFLLTRETTVDNTVPCDFNGDGNINIADVISMLLFQRSHPGDLGADFNGDGKSNVADAIAMLLAQRAGSCPDASN